MRKLEQIGIIGLFLFCVMNPIFVQSETREDRTIEVSQNIKKVGEFLRNQDYFEEISKLCHEDKCFAIDVHDLNHSLEILEEKVLKEIQFEYGSEKALEAKIKGFSITKILTR
ncbi:MAG: hypothetical protein HFI08_02460 [Bacilli bacterium]|jgi:hypothetical protein|nr:hypothetical protein [Bacilli bacterium]